MVVLGIDPAVTKTGYAIILFERNNPSVADSGCIITDRRMDFALRLKHIYDELGSVIQQYRPEAAALEQTIYTQNVQTAIKMGQARGVALLAAVNALVPTFEYAPREIKQAVTGNGAAPKQQVQRMVAQLLRITDMPSSLDISDAMAVAICHYHRSSLQNRGVR
ncbi:crossover junction endodeoxyribonuclease RuvC [candidate division KSB1 bacterium]|nr:crossover junction endodeoxyribonuclease RuvC [candidate division KSB1 bacterium]